MVFDVAADVIDNTRLSTDYNVVSLAAASLAQAAAPGQFVMIKPGASHDPLLRRPFSIFEILRKDGHAIGVSLLNKRIGVGTSLLYDARPGDRMACLGPLGQPFAPVAAPEEAWMVAGGVGLAPFVTLAEALASRGTPATLFYGGRATSDLFREEIFERLGVRLVLTTEDGSRGERGRVTAPLARALADQPADRPVTLYACGPTPMMRAVADLGRRFNRPTFVSLEPVMGCAMGGCYSCVVPVRRTPSDPSSHFVRSCLAGPVFDAALVDWDHLRGGH
jgi:dihydroorotate dehydrogenase electron transfer subunit